MVMMVVMVMVMLMVMCWRKVMVARMVSSDCVQRGYYLSVITSHCTEMWPSLPPPSLPPNTNNKLMITNYSEQLWKMSQKRHRLKILSIFMKRFFTESEKYNILLINLRVECWTNIDNCSGFRFPPWGWSRTRVMAGGCSVGCDHCQHWCQTCSD